MKVKNNILISILLSFLTLFACVPVIAKDCQKDVIVIQDKSTGYITNCMSGKRMDDLEKRLALLDESMKLYFEQILSNSNQIVRKIEKVDKNQIKTEKFLISMREKILDATELAKSDKGAAIEKLAIESIQTNRKLENTVNQENNKLSPELVDALSNFNFARANEIMDSLNRIEGTVNRVESKVDQTNSYVSKTQDLQLIENAISSGSMGDTGHIAAFERVVKGGGEFSGRNLNGLFLGKSKLDNIKLNNSTLIMSNLSDSSFTNSNFVDAKMLSMDAFNSVFDNANMSGSFGEAMDMRKSKFRKANLSVSSWAMADLREADFSEADLSGMNLSLSDLRGANFTKAKLIGTFFGAADLRGAIFDGAIIEQADVSGAILDNNSPLIKVNGGTCTTRIFSGGSGPQVEISAVDPVPSSYYSDGYKYNRLIDKNVPITTNQIGSLPKCGEKRWALWAEKIGKSWKRPPVGRDDSGEQFVNINNSIGFNYPHELLMTAGRREKLTSRLEDWVSKLTERASFVSTNPNSDYLANELVKSFQSKPTPTIPNPLFINDEQAIFLYILKTAPANLTSKINWNLRTSILQKIEAERRHNQKLTKVKQKYIQNGINEWTDIFPENIDNTDTYNEQISKIFKGKNIELSNQLKSSFHIAGSLYKNNISESPSLVLFGTKNIPIPEKELTQELLYQRNRLIWNTSSNWLDRLTVKNDIGVVPVLRLPEPLETYLLPENDFKKYSQNDRLRLDLTLELVNVEYKDKFAIFNVRFKKISVDSL